MAAREDAARAMHEAAEASQARARAAEREAARVLAAARGDRKMLAAAAHDHAHAHARAEAWPARDGRKEACPPALDGRASHRDVEWLSDSSSEDDDEEAGTSEEEAAARRLERDDEPWEEAPVDEWTAAALELEESLEGPLHRVSGKTVRRTVWR